MNDLSMKKNVIMTFSDVSTDIKSSLILMTPMVMICGKVYEAKIPTEEELNKIHGRATVEEGASVIAAILASARLNYGEIPVVGNDGYLALTDVTVKVPRGDTFNMGNLVVFYDQIIGITLGEFDT